MNLDGIIAIHKEADWTSHDVVAKVRRLVGQKRVGHAGTLDPAATGVLPVCLGQATRVVEYLSESGKAYRATIVFGVETTTYDAEGEIVAQQPVPVNLDYAAITAALPQFTGAILQVPPMYSALKRGGKPLYELARAGQTVELEPRPVHIAALTIINWESPTLTLDVECGKGTYIRSLAHDLGAVFGVGAHLAQLTRTRVGPFTLNQTITVGELETALASDAWQKYVYAPDEALLYLRAAILGPASEQRIRNGQQLHLATAPLPDETLLRAYSVDGRFLAILARSGDVWRPTKVFQIAPLDDIPA